MLEQRDATVCHARGDAGLRNTPPADEMCCIYSIYIFIVHRDYMCSLEQNDGKLVLFMIPG